MTASYVTRTGPGGGTPHLHHKHSIPTCRGWIARTKQSAYDGGELGSTGLLRMKEITGKTRPKLSSKKLNANNNFAPEAFTSIDMSMGRELLAA